MIRAYTYEYISANVNRCIRIYSKFLNWAQFPKNIRWIIHRIIIDMKRSEVKIFRIFKKLEN